MSRGEKMETMIGSLPPPDEKARGTISAEDLSAILARARADTAEKVVTIGEEQRKQEEREAWEREAWERWHWEQRQARAIQADARAQRGAGNIAFAQSAGIVAATTLAGWAVGGPIGGIVGAGLGWIGDHLFGGGRP